MIAEHTQSGWGTRLLREWRRAVAAPSVPVGPQAPVPVLSIAPGSVEEGATITLSAAGSTGQNSPLEVLYRLTPPVGPVVDLGTEVYTGGTSADRVYLPTGLGLHRVTLFLHDPVNGLTSTVEGTFTVTQGALDVGYVQVLPNHVDGAVGDAVPLTAHVWSEPTAGTLAQKRSALLSYLQNLTGGGTSTSKRVLSGLWYDSDAPFDAVYAIAGEYPAMWVGDLPGTFDFTDTQLGWAAQGGLLVLHWWPDNPITGGDVGDRSDVDLSKILSGGAKRAEWLAELDVLATQLAVFRDAGYPVIFVPFWAVNTNWYWFADSADFIAVWRDMYTYLNTTKGLGDCLLWMYHAFGAWHQADADDYYPGEAWADLVGFASQDHSLASSNASIYAQFVALNKPIFLALYDVQAPPDYTGLATGPNQISYAPMMADIKSSLPNIVGWWLSGTDYRSPALQGGCAAIMQDAWTIARDDYAARPGAGAAVELLGRLVEWLTGTPTIASIPQYGQEAVLQLLSPGSTYAQASCEGHASPAVQVNVSSPVAPVDHVTLDHTTVSDLEGTTHAVVATPYDAAGNPLDPSRITGWNTDNAAVAFHSPADGLIHLVGVGVAHIQAWGDYEVGSNVLTVTVTSAVAVASVTVTPAGPLTVIAGSGTGFVARTWSGPGGTGTELFGRTVTWTSSNHTAAADPASGYSATANWLAAGDTSIQAHCAGVGSNSVSVHVDPYVPPSGDFYPLLAQMPSSGRVLVFETNWDGAKGGVVEGSITTYSWRAPGVWPDAALVTATDLSAPVNPPTVLDYIYEIGQPAGQCPSGLWLHAANEGVRYRRLYVCDVTKIVGPTFQVSGSAMTKHWGYLGFDTGTTDFILALFRWAGGDAGYLSIDFGCQGGPLAGTWSGLPTDAAHASQDPYGRWRAPGSGPAVVIPTHWGRTEWLLEMNDVGQNNGRIRCQFTDLTAGTPPVMVIDTDRLAIRNSARPGGFHPQRDLVPVFGGGGIAKYERDVTRWAHTRIIGQGVGQ